eukprot:COSAG06_NODE_45534_length_354_cov_0.607843_1_plen_101_part_10
MMPPTTAAPCYFTYATRLRAGEARGSARRRLCTAKHSVTQPSAPAVSTRRTTRSVQTVLDCDENCECDGRAPCPREQPEDGVEDGAPVRRHPLIRFIESRV